MPVTSFTTIEIEFATRGWGSAGPSDGRVMGRLIRLVEKQTETTRVFTVYDREQPVRTLDASETEHLLHLLEQIAVTAPWDAMFGFNGTICTLVLKGAMSHMSFSWWCEVPKGWESVGAVFDYIMAITEHRRK